MGWRDDIASTDEDVDTLLGDDIEFSPGGAEPFVTIQGFANPTEMELGLAGLDPMDGKPRLKIAKRILPVPSAAHRFRSVDLEPGVTWRPEQWVSGTRGRYWLIEVQKAVTA